MEAKVYNLDKNGELFECCKIGEDGEITLVVSKVMKQEIPWGKPPAVGGEHFQQIMEGPQTVGDEHVQQIMEGPQTVGDEHVQQIRIRD